MLLWGSNARAAHPIFFHHVLKGIHNGMRLVVVDPRRTESAEWGDLWLGIDVGTDIAPVEHDRARDHRERPPAPHVHRAGHARLRRVPRLGDGLDPRARRAGDRRAGRRDPRGRARLREGRPRHDLLDARHHRAPQRGGQRAGADQPRAADRARRRLRQRREPAARAEQRAGRRRHGRDPEQARRASRTSSATPRAARGSRRPGACPSRPKYGWTLTQMFEAMERGELTRRVRDRREPGDERGRQHSTRCTCSRTSTR